MVRGPAVALAAFAGASLLGGCADLMQRSTFAPEWFQAKAVEVKGEGYPELADIPQARDVTGKQDDWETDAARLRAEAAKVDEKTNQLGPLPTDEEIRAMAAQLRARLGEVEEAAPEGVQP
jgi:hypothetical protein